MNCLFCDIVILCLRVLVPKSTAAGKETVQLSMIHKAKQEGPVLDTVSLKRFFRVFNSTFVFPTHLYLNLL